MTDLHTHLLPGVDDGAADLKTAVELVRMQAAQGVKQIALTSHYYPEQMRLENFLARRCTAWNRFIGYPAVRKAGCAFRVGAEVHYSTALMDMDLQLLCMAGTRVLLLELPVYSKPPFLRETLQKMSMEGILPLIAHPERCHYVQQDPTLAAEWIADGAYLQINGPSLLRQNRRGRTAMKLIGWGMAHTVASDTHDPEHRGPCLPEALEAVEDRWGRAAAERLQHNAEALFRGEEPEQQAIHIPRKIGPWWI